MTFGLVTSHGLKILPHWSSKGDRVTAVAQKKLLLDEVIPWAGTNFAGTERAFTWDSPLVHLAKRTQQLRPEKMRRFWSKEMWPSNSPNLNPLDFSI